jgi:hypothetical protein
MEERHAAELQILRKTYRPGARVRFLGFGTEDPSTLPIGCEGTISLMDSLGTVHVNWDNGLRLGMVLQAVDAQRPDRIVVLS